MSHSFRFITLVAIFVTCLIAANITAVKLVSIFGLLLPAAIVIFPISYILGDVLTEVYGYRETRRVIWLGFLAGILVQPDRRGRDLDRPGSAGGVVLGRPGSLRAHPRGHAANPRGLVPGLSGGRVRQRLRARQDEDRDPGALAGSPR
jgi:hypothetical protein